jgi:hypothetical protein
MTEQGKEQSGLSRRDFLKVGIERLLEQRLAQCQDVV